MRFDSAPEHRRAGEWLRRNAGALDAAATSTPALGQRLVVMSRKPWVAFYSGALVAELPDATPDSLFFLARARRAAVLVADERSTRTDRPQLRSLLFASSVPRDVEVLHAEAGPPSLVLYRMKP